MKLKKTSLLLFVTTAYLLILGLVPTSLHARPVPVTIDENEQDTPENIADPIEIPIGTDVTFTLHYRCMPHFVEPVKLVQSPQDDDYRCLTSTEQDVTSFVPGFYYLGRFFPDTTEYCGKDFFVTYHLGKVGYKTFNIQYHDELASEPAVTIDKSVNFTIKVTY